HQLLQPRAVSGRTLAHQVFPVRGLQLRPGMLPEIEPVATAPLQFTEGWFGTHGRRVPLGPPPDSPPARRRVLLDLGPKSLLGPVPGHCLTQQVEALAPVVNHER